MRRIVMFLSGTVTAVVLLFGYHTSTAGALLATTTTASAGSSAAATSGNTASGGTSSSGGSSSGGETAGTRTVTGPVVPTQWGPVQVQLTVTGGRITDVTVLQRPTGNPRDDEINGYALPILVQSTLAAQDGRIDQIDMVSGATVTSYGYLQSLQAALDQAGI